MSNLPDLKARYSANSSLNLIIKFGQLIGILPLYSKKFQWRTPKTFYTLFLICWFVINFIFCFIFLANTKFSLTRFAIPIYNINAALILILYCILARKWTNFIDKWDEMDRKMNRNYGILRSLNKRYKITIIVFISLVIFDYVFLIIYFSQEKYSTRDYYQFTAPEYFYFFPYNFFTASIASISSIYFLSIWTFNDLFIITISSILAMRFKQLTNFVKHNKTVNSNHFWIKLREDYNNLANLSKHLDNNICQLILVSFTTNIFLILLQLLNNLDFDIVYALYYFYTLAYLGTRIISVSLYAAWINDESKQIMFALNSLNSTTYNIEIQRLLQQISFDEVALTGSKLFKITRGILINIASAIFTYELVLKQFSDNYG